MDYPEVILFGEGNYNTLGVLHELHDLGIDPLLLIVGTIKDIAQGNIIGYSRYTKRIQQVETANDGIQWIKSNRDFFTSETIIYPTSDMCELILAEHSDTLMPQFRFPCTRGSIRVNQLMDKEFQTNLARESGLRTLQSQYTASPNFSYKKVEYPCMVKPANSTRGSKGDMRVCHTEKDLQIAIKTTTNTHDFIVQHYIENEADLLFLGVALSDHSVWIPAVIKKPGVSPIGEYTHAIVSTDVMKYLPEFSAVQEFIKKTTYTGPFSIEFGLENGKNYFFEMNFRNDGTSHYPLSAGINIAQAYIMDKYPSEIPIVEFEMIDEVGDMRRVLNKEISFFNWTNSFRKAGAYKYYYKNDYSLITPLFKMFFSRLVNKAIRKFQK